MDFIRTTKLSNINFANSNCSIHTPTDRGRGDSDTESTGHPVTLEAQNHFLLLAALPIYPCPNKLIFWSGNIKFSKQWKYHVSYFLKYIWIFWTFFLLRILLPLRWDRRQKTPEMNELETDIFSWNFELITFPNKKVRAL